MKIHHSFSISTKRRINLDIALFIIILINILLYIFRNIGIFSIQKRINNHFDQKLSEELETYKQKIEASNKALADIYERRMQNFSRFADKVHEVYAELYSHLAEVKFEIDLLVYKFEKEIPDEDDYDLETRDKILVRASEALYDLNKFLSKNTVYFSYDIEKQIPDINAIMSGIINTEAHLLEKNQKESLDSRKIQIDELGLRNKQLTRYRALERQLEKLKATIQKEISEGFHYYSQKEDANDS